MSTRIGNSEIQSNLAWVNAMLKGNGNHAREYRLVSEDSKQNIYLVRASDDEIIECVGSTLTLQQAYEMSEGMVGLVMELYTKRT